MTVVRSRRCLPYSQELTTGPYLDPVKSNPHLISLRSVLILSSHLHIDFVSSLFPSAFQLKSCVKFSSLSCLLHVPSFLHLDLKTLLISGKESTNCKGPHYTVILKSKATFCLSINVKLCDKVKCTYCRI